MIIHVDGMNWTCCSTDWSNQSVVMSICFSSRHLLVQIYQWKRQNNSKQPSRGVLRKRCSQNMEQIYRRISMLIPIPIVISMKLQSNFIEIALQHGSSKFAAYFQNTVS